MEWGSGRSGKGASDEEEHTDEPAAEDGPASVDEDTSIKTGPGETSHEEPEAESERVPEDDESPRPSRFPIPSWLLAVMVIAVFLVTYSALRIAGEQRYQSCVQGVSASLGSSTDPLSRLVRTQSVRRCSHSPF